MTRRKGRPANGTFVPPAAETPVAESGHSPQDTVLFVDQTRGRVLNEEGSMKMLKAMAIVTASASIALTVGNARADQSRGESLLVRFLSISLVDLEDAFWRCDYQATTRGGAGSQITLCVEVYEALKQ